MSHITLVRHGQANTGARDEAEYDRLSPLGHKQAEWLGEHLSDTKAFHPRVFCGTLTRHIETASSMGFSEAEQDARLNELNYFDLAHLLEAQKGIPIPQEREGFVEHLPMVFGAWERGEIDGAPESWSDFRTRVNEVLTEISQGSGPALVVTSGGTISMAMAEAMQLENGAMARMALAIMNTSVHRLFPIGGHWAPVLFNAVPHLETPDRHYAQTHV